MKWLVSKKNPKKQQFICYSEMYVNVNLYQGTHSAQFEMAAPVLSHFEIPPVTSGNVKAKCKHCASWISGRTDSTVDSGIVCICI